MRPLNLLFSDYSNDHQNSLNQKIHYICVPLIVYSLMGILWCLPHLETPWMVINWAWIFAAGALVYYFLLTFKLAVIMVGFMALFFASFQFMLKNNWPLMQICIGTFVLAWIGQFYGHKVEGKKPSFLTDLTYLFIGPLWVLEKLFFKKK